MIRNLLDQIPYEAIERPVVEFPPRPDKGNYEAPNIDDHPVITDFYGLS